MGGRCLIEPAPRLLHGIAVLLLLARWQQPAVARQVMEPFQLLRAHGRLGFHRGQASAQSLEFQLMVDLRLGRGGIVREYEVTGAVYAAIHRLRTVVTGKTLAQLGE